MQCGSRACPGSVFTDYIYKFKTVTWINGVINLTESFKKSD